MGAPDATAPTTRSEGLMEPVTRRNALRLVGAGASAGVVGTPLLAGGISAPLYAGDPVLNGRRTGIRRTLATGVPHLGMSSPADVWDQRLSAVGPGVTARRIFADLAQGPDSQLRLVTQAHRAGQLPVISYKVGGDVEGAISGRFDEVAAAAAARLAAFDQPTAVTFWHEPHGDMTPSQYVAASRRILPAFQRGRLKVGPLLNGWLLDRQVETFASYTSDELFELWDWFGLDTYESGTLDSPGEIKPASRIRAARRFLKSRGVDLPLGIGEYNGYSAQSIEDVGRALLTTRDVWFGCVWNSTGGKGYELTGDRLSAYRRSLATAKVERRRAVRRARRRASRR